MKRGAIPLSGVAACGLPREIWELIFESVDEASLSHHVPLTCVFFHKQSFGNASLWRRKCAARFGHVVKPEQLTWKQYYFCGNYEQLIIINSAAIIIRQLNLTKLLHIYSN